MAHDRIQKVFPAHLKPGVTLDQLDAAGPAAGRRPGGGPCIRGKALIFWDPRRPGRKLDAIDTDQITPATDCVSESLDELEKRWKEGAFRHLMPSFRERVHRGETFLIAGDRFAIGSSREMSPAGLKAVAEEVGLELVVVCGDNMGDIFRRNSLNLGLHVVQCPEAVAEAQDGDVFLFDVSTRALTNETQGRRYAPKPLTPKEDEIRLSGGIFAIGRREFAASVRRAPSIEWPDERTAARMSTTEQIVWAHRVDKDAEVRPGATLRVWADLLPASDGTAPFAIHTFTQITGGARSIRGRSRSPTTTSSSPGRKRTNGRPPSAGSSRDCTESRGPFTRHPGTASSTSIFPSRDSCSRVISSPARTRTAGPTARTVRWESAWDRRRSVSAGRPATSISRWQLRAGSP